MIELPLFYLIFQLFFLLYRWKLIFLDSPDNEWVPIFYFPHVTGCFQIVIRLKIPFFMNFFIFHSTNLKKTVFNSKCNFLHLATKAGCIFGLSYSLKPCYLNVVFVIGN